jgi:hypothetical protein
MTRGLWREGRHWQADIECVSVWVGIATDRWMVGVVFNPQALLVGFGVGGLYFGIGAGEFSDHNDDCGRRG